MFAIDYNEDYDPYRYFVSALVSRQILFLVSSGAAEDFDNWDVAWPAVNKPYRREILDRMRKAGGKVS